MIDKRNKLKVFHDDNGSFSDYSDKAADYIRDNFTVTLVSAQDYLYLGFDRPFNSVYAELITPNANANSFTAQIWDGTAWTTLQLDDESNGFTRSGFLYWDKADMNNTTVNSVAKYYIRLKPSVDHTATTIRGLNLVFSDDVQMKQEFFEITNSNILPAGESSHISSHVAARNTIVQELRNLGYIKEEDDGDLENLTYWDLHDIFEVRQAATYLALSKVFFNLSDSPEDNWWRKYTEYQDKFKEAFRLARISLDLNNDGVEDSDEKRQPREQVRFTR